MANQDVFDGVVFPEGHFSTDVTLAGDRAVVNSVDAFGSMTLTGTIGAAGDIASVAFDDGAGHGFAADLSALFDFDGGIAFSDGNGDCYLFSATPLVAGMSFLAASGFGNEAATGAETACYVAGTRIATDRGPVAVELLRRGDMVTTMPGRGHAEVIWTGRRDVRCATHPRPHEVWPVLIAADAFGNGQPERELRVSPGHALFVDGALVPAAWLLNGATVRQLPCATVRYHHFELANHTIVLAEGLPAESYLDVGNRHSFADAGKVVMAIAAFEKSDDVASTGPSRCAPWLSRSAALEPLRARLRNRAARLGYHETDEPDLRVEAVCRGVRTRLASKHLAGGLRVVVPPEVSAVCLASRSAVPSEQVAGSSDARRLGVSVTRIAVDGRDVPLADPRLGLGWHGLESTRRWTSGYAALKIGTADHPRELEIETESMLRYWIPGACGCRASDRARL